MPSVIERDCHTCGKALEPALASLGMLNHPSCDPVPQDLELMPPPTPAEIASITTFTPTGGPVQVPEPSVAKALKDEFTTMLLWSESNTPRSRQANIGPSELGVECDRRLAYRVAGITGDGGGLSDPWPAFVGSAIHTRVEDAVRGYLAGHPHAPKWLIEQFVRADPLIGGRADFYRDNVLADLKSGGKDKMDEVRKHGPQLSYRVQQMVYAKGLRDAGVPIEYIALIFVPRSGWLRDMYVWAERYDEALALEYLGRPYRLAQKITELDILNHPHRWEQIPASPSYACTYCPLYNKYLPEDLGATDKGCPGYQGSKKK